MRVSVSASRPLSADACRFSGAEAAVHWQSRRKNRFPPIAVMGALTPACKQIGQNFRHIFCPICGPSIWPDFIMWCQSSSNLADDSNRTAFDWREIRRVFTHRSSSSTGPLCCCCGSGRWRSLDSFPVASFRSYLVPSAVETTFNLPQIKPVRVIFKLF